MAVRASRTSSSLNGLIIAITIFMGPIPAWARPGRYRAFFRLRHTTRESFTTRAQPRPIESNAVPDRVWCLTNDEHGYFTGLPRRFPDVPFRRAQRMGDDA